MDTGIRAEGYGRLQRIQKSEGVMVNAAVMLRRELCEG